MGKNGGFPETSRSERDSLYRLRFAHDDRRS